MYAMEVLSSPCLRIVMFWCCIQVFLHCRLELQQVHGCLQSERDGLLSLKAQFNHPNGSYLPSWDADLNIDCCKWENVTCDPFTNRVTGLSLRQTRFNRTLVLANKTSDVFLNASIFLPFEDLQILDLAYNDISGLEELPRLGNLKMLDLSINCIKTMPSVHVLPSLKILNLLWLQLSSWDELAAEITALKKLELLNLGYNNFDGSIPLFIGDSASLKSLSFRGSSMHGSKFNGSFPAEVLCRLKNLEELDLSSNLLEGSLPLCLAELTSLRVLDLHDNNLTGSIPTSLFTSLNSLEYVSLSSNTFKGSFSFSSLANNPNLEVLELVNGDRSLEVDIENPLGWNPLFQLKVLRLSNCTLNKLTEVVPSFLLTQHQLRLLELDNIGLKGNILRWLLGNNTSLEFVTLSNNSLQGTFYLNPSFYNPHLHRLDVSSNHISGEIPLLIGSAMPNLKYLNMSGNALTGPIPHSIGEMRNLFSLDLSNNFLSGEVPASLAMSCFNLKFLKLSNNSFHGSFPPLTSNLKALLTLHLDNNNFTGFTKGVLNSDRLGLLDVSQNVLSGNIPNWIGNLKFISTLVLSKNFLEGPVPISICNISRLRYLDLSHNHLGPTLPPCSRLPKLSHFHVSNNQLIGPVPDLLSRAPSLVTLDLSHNKLSREIPSWFAASLPNLRVILLKGNILNGTIPFSLCVLRNISILDFSNNNLSGPVPFCLSEMLLGRRFLLDGSYTGPQYDWGTYGSLKTYSCTNQLDVYPIVESVYYMRDENDLIQFVTKKRDESYEGNVLYHMSGVDLSCNKLQGPISPEIGLLNGIHTLNLSHNYLSGSIPVSFSNMEQIESLDLSHNTLSGEIPRQLLGLNFLSVFSVAYNNLSGMTLKMVGQFSTFDVSSYEGNPHLYGPPLTNCPFNDCHTQPSNGEDEGEFGNTDQHYIWYSFAGSSVVMFLALCGYFYLNPYPLETILNFITGTPLLSRVPYCKKFAERLEVNKNVSIKFVLDR